HPFILRPSQDDLNTTVRSRIVPCYANEVGRDRWARRENHWCTTAGPAIPPYLKQSSVFRWQTRPTAVHEEIIALVIDEDERREILHLDFPHRLHAEFGIFEHLDLLDVLFREDGGRAPDAAEIEAAVLLARVRYLRAAVAFCQHHH